jgi:integrase
LFGLLAVTGLRVAEARGLARSDVNLSQALLTVRQSKGQKTRWVPLHPSTQQALQRYARRRDRLCPHPVSPNFFVSARGTGLTRAIVRAWFQRAAQRSDLRTPPEGRRPRLHDLRHRFAIRTLLGWYRTKKDVEAHLPELATYLGHAHVASTYWYLTATPELLQAAMRCWQRHEGGRGR